MNKSDTIGKLAAALAKAQSEMEPAKKESRGNYGKFADLGDVIDAIRKVSTPNGLSFSQFPVGDSAGVGVSTILLHESGEWLSDTIYLPATDEMSKRNGAQAAGISITYLRRYALAAVFGVYADEDTDGEQAQRQQAQPVRQNPPRPTQPTSQPAPAPNVEMNLRPGGIAIPSHSNSATNTDAHTSAVVVPSQLAILVRQYASRTYGTPEKAKGARGLASGVLDEYAGDTDRRRSFLMAVFGKDSSSALTDGQVAAILAWKDAPNAKSEVNRVIADWLKVQGQQELFSDAAQPQPA